MQQSGKKREPTLKELMTAQGKLARKPQQPPQPQVQPKPVQTVQPAAKPRTEADKKQQAADLAKAFDAQMPQKQAPSKEDKLRDMINEDPERAAELLRQMFFK